MKLYRLKDGIGLIQDGHKYVYKNHGWYEQEFDHDNQEIALEDALNALGIVLEDVPLAWYDWVYSKQVEWLKENYGMFDADGNWTSLPEYAPERIQFIYSHVKRIEKEAHDRGFQLD